MNNLLRRLLGGERTEATEARIERTKRPAEDLIRAIWTSPVDYNRETRRRARLFGRIWKWDLSANEKTRRTYVPRYIRRHYKQVPTSPSRTRRQRRHWAVIQRISQRKGIA